MFSKSNVFRLITISAKRNDQQRFFTRVFQLTYIYIRIYICSSFYADELFGLRRDDDDTPRRLRNAIECATNRPGLISSPRITTRQEDIFPARESNQPQYRDLCTWRSARDGNEPCRLTGSSHPFPCMRLKRNDPSDANRRFNNGYLLREGKCRRAVIFSLPEFAAFRRCKCASFILCTSAARFSRNEKRRCR